MSNYFRPAVVTSRRAQDDMARIKGIHTDVLMGMSVQKVNVESYNQQKQAEMQQQQVMKADMDKAKMVADTTSQKNALDFQTKQAEIDVKRAALSMKD